MKPQSLIFERTYQAPVELVWQAITDKDQIKEWSFEVSDFKPEVGFTFHFYGESDGIKFLHLCVVTEVTPPVRLSYTWRYEEYTGQSLLTFELFPEGENTTRLKLTHSGTETFPLDNPLFSAANFTEGWNALLDQLAELCKKE